MPTEGAGSENLKTVDIVTQGLLGAVAAQAVSRPGQLRVAAAIGMLAALLPDADVLIRSAEDPLLTLAYHRHFSHSLIFVPFGALLAAMACWPFVRRGAMSFARVYGYALAGCATAGLLDAFTSYGTHLFWPFSDTPVALSIIAIVDPVFSGVLLILGGLGWVLRRRYLAVIGLSLALAYLALGAVQHQRALSLAETLAAERGLEPERILVKPTLANLVLWRSVIEAGDTAYVDALRVGLDPRVYSGSKAELLKPEAQGFPENSRAHRDLERFYRFSDGWLVRHPEQPSLYGDLRFALLPTSAIPLWGIALDPANPEAAPRWVTLREMSPALRNCFMAMLKGETLGAADCSSAKSTPEASR